VVLSYPRLVIAGLKGGSGKTILSVGLIASFKQKGVTIVPFKKGPDYIDAGWLSCAARHPCYNLDAFLIGEERILSSFKEHAKGIQCAIIEGNRGLFDGMDSEGKYSTAELAKSLSAPVVLIIDCTKMTRTTAVIAEGVYKFDSMLKICGVVLNQIANARHESVIKKSFEKYCQIPVLGAIPRLNEEFFPERHMGLTPYHEHEEVEESISAVAGITEKYVDTDALWKIAHEAPPLEVQSSKFKVQSYKNSSLITHHSSIKIGVIKDSAFQFYYPENLEELQKNGAELVEISALKEKQLPPIDALYIGGGFPETHAIALAENIEFRRHIKKAVEDGLPVYAECGGLMYLGESLVMGDQTYPMAGIFPISFCLEKNPNAHGYTIIEVDHSNSYYPVGTKLRGHEFHYSRVLDMGERDDMYFAFTMKRGKGIVEQKDGLCYKNVLATYTHLHALGALEWTHGLVTIASLYKRHRENNNSHNILTSAKE
jgi:cobyrinic acid a,c-diamide synthase